MSSKQKSVSSKYVGKPFIKKIYETHKKWLSPTETKKSIDETQKETIPYKKSSHVYENVEYKKNEENISKIEMKKKEEKVINCEKLQIVIGNFDKILDEYSAISLQSVPKNKVESVTPKKNADTIKKSVSAPNSTVKRDTRIPKLVKAKTCSIIESKCILKKTNSHPDGKTQLKGPNDTKLQNKTKSMNNIDVNAVCDRKVFQKNLSTPKSTLKLPACEAKIDETPTKVKELVKRLNSLTETTTPETEKVSKPLSKSISTTDLSFSRKSSTFSKIPVNTTLRKSFPSTPCHLDKLDSTNGSTLVKKQQLNGRLAKSVQNLTKTSQTKLSLPKKVPEKSLQNTYRKPLPRPRSVRDLSKNFDSGKQSRTNENIARNVEKPTAPLKDKFERQTKAKIAPKIKSRVAVPDHLKDKSSKERTQNVADSPKVHVQQASACIVTAKNILVKVEKLSSKIRQEEKVDPKEAFVAVKAPKKELVKNVCQKLEETVESIKPRVIRTDTFKKVGSTIKDKLTVKRTDTFGVKKSQFEPKFPEKSTKDINKATFIRKNCTEKVKLDLKRTQNFLEITNCDGFYLDPNDFIDSKVENVIDYTQEGRKMQQIEGIAKDQPVIKNLDYNSDDSGNISNEIELDDLNSASPSSIRSRTTTESFSTVLEQSDNSIDVIEDLKAEKEKIFFRNGVVSQLESQRDERLVGMVVDLQAHCRGYLARRRLQQRKLQDLAVRCIQRNVRKFMLVRDWPWWRLLVRVTPLLNVHRTEEELRMKTDELQALKLKLEKLENDRTSLKHDNDKLEAKLSEMTADLAEEHSTSTLATERLEAETSERLRLERELSETQHKNKELQQSSERLEMELLYARSDLNGISEEDEEGDGDGVYKQRYERAVRELEFTKRRLQQQHEDDLEQLVGLKKQLEKKLADAYEEVEEQRQVVGQWKRKVQKLNGEMNDLKLLLEEQSSRNNLLEKKQRKFDSETQMLQDELKKERQAKDRLSREREVFVAEKYSIESTLADTRLELELKEEKLAALQREFDEITCGGKTEEEVTILRKQKIDCERRLQDQEEELDELAGQVQLLEQAKLRLEMTLESMRKEAKKEAQMRDEEVEEIRCNAQKKLKALECQLENEHEERTLLLREKHELERRLQAAADAERNDRAGDEALLHRLKRDLKRTKALLRDTQAQLERQKAETPGKNMIRQLRNQLEDLECARALAIKTKQSLETDLSETQALLEESHRQKSDCEDRANALTREKAELQSQLEENEEELAEVLKKYKATVQQMSLDQMALQEQVSLVSELEVERNQLKEQLAELTSKLENVESMGDASSNLLLKRTELKVKELESKLELEQTTRSRLEVQIARLKEALDKLQTEVATSRVKEQTGQDQIRKLQRTLREIKEELNKSLAKESEVIIKKKELEKRCETLEAECSTSRTDLRLALKRIEDLQSAIQGELEDSISDNSESEQDSYSSDESVNTFLANHKLGSPKNEKVSLANDIRRLSSTSRSSTSSNLGKDSSYA